MQFHLIHGHIAQRIVLHRLVVRDLRVHVLFDQFVGTAADGSVLSIIIRRIFHILPDMLGHEVVHQSGLIHEGKSHLLVKSDDALARFRNFDLLNV